MKKTKLPFTLDQDAGLVVDRQALVESGMIDRQLHAAAAFFKQKHELELNSENGKFDAFDQKIDDMMMEVSAYARLLNQLEELKGNDHARCTLEIVRQGNKIRRMIYDIVLFYTEMPSTYVPIQIHDDGEEI